MLRINNLHIVWGLNIRGGYDAFPIFTQAQRDLITIMKLEYDTLQVQQDINHILLNTIKS